MPGFKKEEIKLSLEGDVLTIAAEHTTEKTAEDASDSEGSAEQTDTAKKGTYLQRSAVSVSICSAWISATWMQTALMRHMKTAC